MIGTNFTSIRLGDIIEEMREHLKVCNSYPNDKPNLG
jgi:hypothetical protein